MMVMRLPESESPKYGAQRFSRRRRLGVSGAVGLFPWPLIEPADNH